MDRNHQQNSFKNANLSRDGRKGKKDGGGKKVLPAICAVLLLAGIALITVYILQRQGILPGGDRALSASMSVNESRTTAL